jgi:hypothetical protein
MCYLLYIEEKKKTREAGRGVGVPAYRLEPSVAENFIHDRKRRAEKFAGKCSFSDQNIPVYRPLGKYEEILNLKKDDRKTKVPYRYLVRRVILLL